MSAGTETEYVFVSNTSLRPLSTRVITAFPIPSPESVASAYNIYGVFTHVDTVVSDADLSVTT